MPSPHGPSGRCRKPRTGGSAVGCSKGTMSNAFILLPSSSLYEAAATATEHCNFSGGRSYAFRRSSWKHRDDENRRRSSASYWPSHAMPISAYFQPDLFDFLRQLNRHNHREWFAKNKHRYEQTVVAPALAFIAAFGHISQRSAHGSLPMRAPRVDRFSASIATRDFPPISRVQNTRRHSLLARKRQRCARTGVLSASATGALLCRRRRLARR